MIRWQILLKIICIIRRTKQCKCVINITSIDHRFEVITTISKPIISKTTHQNVAKARPNEDPTATPSTCLWYFLLKVNKDSLVAMVSRLRKSCFGILGGFSLSLCKLPTQISMVSFRGIFVKKESFFSKVKWINGSMLISCWRC